MRLLLSENKTGQNSIGTECLTRDKLDSTDLESMQACCESVLENRYAANKVSNFIMAERSGDCNFHLITVSRMLNISAATAHNQLCKMCMHVLANDVGFAGFTSMSLWTVPVPRLSYSTRQWQVLVTDLIIAEDPWRPQSRQRTDQVCLLHVGSYHAQQ